MVDLGDNQSCNVPKNKAHKLGFFEHDLTSFSVVWGETYPIMLQNC